MPSPDSKAIPQKIISVQAEYRLLREIEKNPDISQRELSHRLEIGLAVTNALIKKIVQRGWIRIQGLKPRKIAYLLTPAGFKEKGKIAYNFVKRTLVYYREAKEVLEK
jgi:DNA-binding Lrp family transcriptional regulator